MKYLIYTLLTWGLVFASQAQVSLKPAAGFNFTSLSEDPATGNTTGRFGWQVGATVASGDKFYGEAGLFYATTSTEISDTLVSFDNNTTGVRIPVMGGYHLIGSQGSTASLRVFGGGQIFILTGVDADPLTRDDFNSPTGGVFAGAGATLGFFFVDVSYLWSLTDVTKTTGPEIGQNRSLFINAGINIKLSTW